MSLVDLCDEAKRKGELVYYFNQAETDVLQDPDQFGVSKQGFCMGLAIQWIVLRLQKSDFSGTLAKPLSVVQTYRAAHDHATYEKAFRAIKKEGGWGTGGLINLLASNQVLTAYKLKTYGEPMKSKGAGSALFLLDCAKERRGLALLDWQGETAHATAIDIRLAEQRFNYFDANCGHFQLEGTLNFRAWFERYLKASGYAKRYSKSLSYHPLGLLL